MSATANTAYTSWAAQVINLGGNVTTWPFQTNGWFGIPAAVFDQATYATLMQQGLLDQNSAQSNADGTLVYVAASDAVAAAAPGNSGLGGSSLVYVAAAVAGLLLLSRL